MIVYSVVQAVSFTADIIWQKGVHYKVILSAANGLAGYEQKEGIGYLTVLYGEGQREMTVRVPDENLQNRLAETPLEEIQALYLDIHIPYKKLKELGLNEDVFENGFDVLSSGLYDEYVNLADVWVR